MSCDLAKDVVTSLKEAARAQRKQTNHTSGKFLFGHVTTLMSLLANMQLFDVSSAGNVNFINSSLFVAINKDMFSISL